MAYMLTEDQKRELAKALEPTADTNTDSSVPFDVSFTACIYAASLIYCYLLYETTVYKYEILKTQRLNKLKV